MADSPELFSLLSSKIIFILPIIIFFPTLFIYFYKKNAFILKFKSNLILYAVIPFFILACFIPTIQKSNFVHDSKFDEAPKIVKNMISLSNCNLTIISNDLAGLYRSSYYFDIPMSNMRYLKEHEYVKINDLYACTEYILFFGNFNFDKKINFILRSEPDSQNNWGLAQVSK